MRRFLSTSALTITLAACGIAVAGQLSRPTRDTTRSPAAAANAMVAVRSTNALGLDLLRAVGDPTKNVVLSPYSIQAALAMADAGAAGDTAKQINAVLHGDDAATLDAGNGALARRLMAAVRAPRGTPRGDAARLDVANGLFTQSGLTLNAPFSQTLADDFSASPQLLDFRHRPEPSRLAINRWVGEHTGGLINNLMPQGSITFQTVLVLANAIHVKAHWSSPFDPERTSKRSFFTDSGFAPRVPFMTRAPTELEYASGLGYRAVELPYLDSSLSMLIVMPTAGTLAQFERTLTISSLDQLLGSLATSMVELRMPRFHLLAHVKLNDVLGALGMPLAFTDRADFSRITAKMSLKIQAVEHGAELKVDEQGTVAAAATGISFLPTSAPGGPIRNLTLDHPFLLFLRDNSTGAILFAGRVADPSQS
jgi:serine protease inhibitor